MKVLHKSSDEHKLANKGKILLIIIILTIFTIVWVLFYMNNSYPSSSTTFVSLSLDEHKGHLFKLPQDSSYDTNSIFKTNKVVFQGEKIVHLDLKGAPPKVSYYTMFFNLLVKLGATGVIIEYEDMFPYHGILANISAANAYSLNDINAINNIAKKLQLKIIPLIQTFGHMEFILKYEEWEHLRELPKYPQVICPSQNETLTVLKEMVEQIIKAHPDSNMLHIGADEVYLLGECDKCFIKMNMKGWTKQKLFLNHVSTVTQMIKENHPNIRLLMWDDEFRKVRQEDLENWKISSLVEPVVWKYETDVYTQLGPSLWDMYANAFPRIWIASAFKGATGSDRYTTDIGYHLDNHKSWMQVVGEYSGRIKFEGIILTGWQRYDHFAVLCELLPVGIPSLAMCLHYIQGFIDSSLAPPKAVSDLLHCENPYALLGPALGTPKCGFPGGNILEGVLKLQQLKQDFNNLLENSKVRGWMTEYNIDHLYSNTLFVAEAVESLDMFKMELYQIDRDLRDAMQLIYDEHTISEWCDTFIKPLNKKIDQVWQAKEKLLSKHHWPRRPLASNLPNKEL